ncbi:MAG: hypothetical protein O2794_00865 [bacterium]|nr:hypothetical protein [bacterium]
MDWPTYDDRPIAGSLLHSIHLHLAELETLLRQVTFNYDDGVYRFYHGSAKVFFLQFDTEKMIERFCTLFIVPLNKDLLTIVEDGTGFKWRLGVQFTLDDTRRVVEAFLHAKYFLEMLVMSGKGIIGPLPPATMPAHWASVLYLYNLR